MTKSKTSIWIFLITGWALLAAIAVYWFARANPPEIFTQFKIITGAPTIQSDFFGNAPSFFYTLAFGLLVGALAPSLAAARLHCLLWIALVFILELSQLSSFSDPLVMWLADSVPKFAWQLFGPYWTRGVFDKLDLLATLAGGGIAILILSCIPRGHKNENNQTC